MPARSTPKLIQRSKRVKSAAPVLNIRVRHPTRPLPVRFSPAKACLQAAGARFGHKKAELAGVPPPIPELAARSDRTLTVRRHPTLKANVLDYLARGPWHAHVT